MSQHLRKRLQTHTVRQADRRGVRVPREVERELFVDAALPGDVFQAVVDRIECRHGKNTSVAGQTPVLVQDEQRIRQKFDNVSGFGLLAVPADPPLALRILLHRLKVTFDDQEVTEMRKINRSDVLMAYQEKYGGYGTNNDECGFDYFVDVNQMKLGEHSILVQLLDEKDKVISEKDLKVNII